MVSTHSTRLVCTAINLCFHQVFKAVAFLPPSPREPCLLVHASRTHSQCLLLPERLGPSQAYQLELCGNFWAIFLKKEKHLGTTERKKKMKERNQKPQILFCDLGLCQIGGNNLQILPKKPQVCSDSALCRLRQWSTPCLREVTESLNSTWLSSRCDRGQRRWPHTSHDLVDLELLENGNRSWLPHSWMCLPQSLWTRKDVQGEMHN